MRYATLGASVVALLGAAACAHGTPPARTAEPAHSAPVASTAWRSSTTTAPKSETASHVTLSDEIKRACGISDEDAYFAFDSAHVDGHAQNVLRKVAVCFESGPLAGRSMRLIGRADPRGDDEYNMVLGEHRAAAVKSALDGLGLKPDRISTTSRGELDARGVDEAGWAKDRRVDVMLGSS